MIQAWLNFTTVSPPCPILPGSPALAAGHAQALPGDDGYLAGSKEELPFPPCLCLPAAPCLSSMNRGVAPAVGAWHGNVAWREHRLVYPHRLGRPIQRRSRLSRRCWVHRAVRERLSLPGPRSLADRCPVCDVISIIKLPLGTLATRPSLIAPVICLSQQAAHPKQGD